MKIASQKIIPRTIVFYFVTSQFFHNFLMDTAD